MKRDYSKPIIVFTAAIIATILCIIAIGTGHGDNSKLDDVASDGIVANEVLSRDPEPLLTKVDSNVIPAIAMSTTTMEVKTTSLPIPFSEEEIAMMAKILKNEADCVTSEAERSMVVWTILNRYDAQLYGDTTVTEICTRPRQFAYDASTPVTDRNYDLVIDVVQRWAREKAGEEHVGRTLPSECLYFLAASDPAAGEWHNTFYSLTEITYGEKISFGYENPLENPYKN